MASVEPYETKAGRRYRVIFRTPDRKQSQKRGFTTKKAALQFASKVELSKSDGSFIDPSAGKISIAEVHELWLPSQDVLAPRTRRVNMSAYNVHVAPRWGTWPVNRITTPDVRKWVSDMQNEGKRRATILRAVHVLRSICDTAVESRKIPVNPVQKVAVQREVQESKGFLTPKQVQVLADSMATPGNKTMIYLMAYCGPRISEVAALNVSDFNPAAQRIVISKSVKDYGVIGPTKTYEQRRVPVPQFLADMLARLTEGRPGNAPLFTSPEGQRVDVDNFRVREFAPAVEAAREKWKADNMPGAFPKIKPHGLRHTCASLAISTGANVKAVQALLGHQSAAITLNVYADLFPDDLDKVGDALNELHASVE